MFILVWEYDDGCVILLMFFGCKVKLWFCWRLFRGFKVYFLINNSCEVDRLLGYYVVVDRIDIIDESVVMF